MGRSESERRLMELLIGCGNDLRKKVTFDKIPKEWCQLVTLDYDEGLNADVHHDLNSIPYPFDDDMFDEVHAYEVLEHCGTQGDWRFFFNQFAEFWRILKPGGYFVATVPMWDCVWAWGDPGHRRIITPNTLVFLSQKEYAAQVGKTAMADYRPWYKADFEPVTYNEKEGTFAFVLKALK
jgi:SAM-dependent methyltransferase